jgi:transcriptional regulator with XRE-family HTH domain
MGTGGRAVTERAVPKFSELLTSLRNKARLSQEELTERAQLSPRTVSDLERGIHQTAGRATAELLANALGLASPAYEEFLEAARGNSAAAQALAARTEAAPLQPLEVRFSLPPDAAAFTGRDVELGRITATVAMRPERPAV